MLCNWFQVRSIFTESPFLREISLEAEKKKEKNRERQGNNLRNRLDSFFRVLAESLGSMVVRNHGVCCVVRASCF